MAATTETVTLKIVDPTTYADQPQANVPALVRYEGTRTSPSGIGASVERYTVLVAGHELVGEWRGDARRKTTVEISADHPLAPAVRKLSAAQLARHAMRELAGEKPSKGMRIEDWREEQDRAARKYYAAKRAVEDDALCAAILGGDLASA